MPPRPLSRPSSRASPPRCSAFRPVARRSPSTTRWPALHDAGDRRFFAGAHLQHRRVRRPAVDRQTELLRVHAEAPVLAASTFLAPTCTFSMATRATIDAECERFEREIASLGGIDLLLLGIGAQRAHRLQRAGARRCGPAPPHRTGDRNPPCECVAVRRAARPGAARGADDGRGNDAGGARDRARRHRPAKSARGRVDVQRQISTAQPASLLQLHPNVEVILDLPAAEKLPKSRFDARRVTRAWPARVMPRLLHDESRPSRSSPRAEHVVGLPRRRGRSRAPTMRRARSRSFSEFDFTSTIRLP